MAVPQGLEDEMCCTNLDGSKDVSYNLIMHSVNNDTWSVTPVTANGSAVPGAFCNVNPRQIFPGPRWGPDSLEHASHGSLPGSSGSFVHLQAGLRFHCDTPGNGKANCELAIDWIEVCGGPCRLSPNTTEMREFANAH